MAIDTRNRRSSAIHVGLPWRGMFPAPDGTITNFDRQHIGGFYAGIAAVVLALPTTLAAEITIGLSGLYTRAAGLGLASYDFREHPLGRLTVLLANGLTLGAADKAYLSDPVGWTLAPSASQSLDLLGLTDDVLGQDLRLISVKAVLIWARPENVHDLIVGAGTNPFVGWFGGSTQTETVPPGTPLIHVNLAGWPVVDGTADILKITNGGAVSDVIYDLAIFGVSG